MALRSITQTSQPRSDVLQGGLTDAHFAAQLDQVVRSPEKYPVYGDPTEFFAVTYPTDGLKQLLASTFGRLSGQAGQVDGAEHGVVRLQTSFGGGKTHGLIAAYHLASGARPLSIGEFVDPDLLPDSC
jgi:predicted AAA+ superfamily ATPase